MMTEKDAKLIGEAAQLLKRVREIRSELTSDTARTILDMSVGAAFATPFLKDALVRAPVRRRR